ncbi:PD-(D/E)XK nuclease family protein [Gordonia amarae]|uniref:PD-(D/E)XK endonuclease-like domain-containing protein n=2 Tax=Gordonia amarae TaxID=36821 RepID=G7GUV7_9ACTN|nr:PD-(D/E)XK nuclease family protein [Gordonia amarae]MCS3876944.1 RecB family exonuclease [Gordonia amarae]QHN15770.1 PD-(D/E)XK nuclease family protein [Gordonia amarae]QHN20339.1 PD-(D/E)XK nuclease family protein [Gordonia amarae]QHN29190.1 PD-(D/E)XK nuclease family protein [Gordonia amarae]QHN37969.1 PD-(D/E)XK nuclease family protein [Gordonia amarae]
MMFDEVVGAVAGAKAGDPLAPVTVVVPTHAAGREVLHALARAGAVANTSIVTFRQVVERLAGPVLKPRQALPYPVLEAAVALVLQERPGVFEEVAGAPITTQALAQAAWQLTELADPRIDASTPLVGDMLRVYREALTEDLTGQYFLKHEAYAAAEAAARTLDNVVVFAPIRTNPALDPLLDVLAANGTVIEPGSDPLPTQVIHTSDADDEVRAVVRLVRKHLAAGVPGHRIGIYYPTPDPYLGLLHEHLTAGRIVFNAPLHRGLGDRPAARALLGLLQIDVAAMPRRDILGFLAEGVLRRPQVPGAEKPVSQRKLELVTRDLRKIVGGADWHSLTEPPPGKTPEEDRYSDEAIALHDFVEALQADLTALGEAGTWPEVSAQLIALLDSRFAGSSEQASADLVTLRQDCAALAFLKEYAPAPTPERILDAVMVRIDSRGGKHGTSGVGVTVGRLADAAGRDLDVVVVLGAAEGVLPVPRRDDPLLPAELTGRTPADSMDAQLRSYQAALATVGSERVVTFPRGSLRGGAERVPSRWLLPALSSLAGTPVDVVGWQKQTLGADSIVVVESFDVAAQHANPRIGASSASETEWRLRALAAVPADRRQDALTDPVVVDGMRMRSDRLHGRFTRFNGNVHTVCDLLTVFDNPVSPTRLEDWVKSPYRFFLTTVLGASELPDPDEAVEIDALTRGNLIHEILELYVVGTTEGAAHDLSRLIGIAEDVLTRAERDNPGWLGHLWARARGTIMRDLRTWHGYDTDDHAHGWTPTDAERTFGMPPRGRPYSDPPEHPAVEFDLGTATIRFRGAVDRIDKHRDGRVRVTDYKSGQKKTYDKITDQQPTENGKRFQLPVYALLAREFGDAVAARYWFITDKGGFAEVGYTLTQDVIDVLTGDLRLVHEMICAGYFPPRTPDTWWADPILDLVGKAGLERAWANLEEVPEITDYVAKYGAAQ